MKLILFCLVVSAYLVEWSDARSFYRGYYRSYYHRSCAERMRIRYPSCEDGEICRYTYFTRYIYQRRVESEKCDTGFAGEFNRTMCGYTNNCTRMCVNEIKYICEPTLEEKAALLVQSLSLGADAAETATDKPSASMGRGKRSFFYSYYWFFRYYRIWRAQSISTNDTCPADAVAQADNTICKDVCTVNVTAVEPTKPDEPIDPNVPVEPFDLDDFQSQANKTKRYRCCGNQDGDRYILFVLDNSAAVSEEEFADSKDFVCSLTKQLCGNIKVALVTYDDLINLEFCFKCNRTRDEICEAVNRVQYRGGDETRTASVTTCAVDEVLSRECTGFESRYSRWSRYPNNVDVVFITSGVNNGPCRSNLTRAVNYCERRGYATHVISVGGASTAFQLTYPHSRNFTNVVFLDDLSDLSMLSVAIENELEKVGDDNEPINSCTRDSAMCRRRYYYYRG